MNFACGREIGNSLFLRVAAGAGDQRWNRWELGRRFDAGFQRGISAGSKGLLQLLQTGTLERFQDGRLVLAFDELLDLSTSVRSLCSLDAASLHLTILPVGILVVSQLGIEHERNTVGSHHIMAMLITMHLDGDPGAISLLHLQRFRISRNSKGGLHKADHQ